MLGGGGEANGEIQILRKSGPTHYYGHSHEGSLDNHSGKTSVDAVDPTAEIQPILLSSPAAQAFW